MTDNLTRHHVTVHPFVSGMGPADIEWLQDHVHDARFTATEVIFRAGEPAGVFYLVRTGLVSLRLGEDRIPARVVQTLREGSALGWSWLYSPYEWQFTAEAASEVHLLGFSAVDLRAAFEENPGFGYRFVSRLAETMAERLHAARRQLVDLSQG